MGKIYNVLAYQLADRIHRKVDGVREAVVRLCSQIGEPIDQPAVVSVQVDLVTGTSIEGVQPDVQANGALRIFPGRREVGFARR